MKPIVSSGKILNSKIATLLIFSLLSLVFFRYFLENITYVGIFDWHKRLTYSAAARETISRYHQFPLWNPWICGGMSLIGSPAAQYISPFIILDIFLGEVIGLKISVIIHFALGMFGLYLLARYLKFNPLSSYVSAFIFSMSGYYAWHIRTGHTNFIVFSWLPWVVYYYLKSMKKLRYVVFSAGFYSIMFLEGHYIGVYLALFLGVASVILFLTERNIAYIKNLVILFILTLLLGSIKIVPVYYYLQEFPRILSYEGISWGSIDFYLLKRAFLESQPTETIYYPAHEFGIYVGAIPLLLALYGLLSGRFEGKWAFSLAGLVFVLMSFGPNLKYDLLEFMSQFPVFNSLRVPSRLLILPILPISLLAGAGLSKIERYNRVLALALTLFILVDLTMVSSSHFKNIFRIQLPNYERENIFYQTSSKEKLQYTHVLRNTGRILCGEDIKFEINAIPRSIKKSENNTYKGEVFLVNNSGDVEIKYFSPNKVVVDVNINGPDTLVLNQNSHRGWRSNVGYIESYNGIVSVNVSGSHNNIIFYYMPSSFLWGVFLSSLGVLLSIIIICLDPIDEESTLLNS